MLTGIIDREITQKDVGMIEHVGQTVGWFALRKDFDSRLFSVRQRPTTGCVCRKYGSAFAAQFRA